MLEVTVLDDGLVLIGWAENSHYRTELRQRGSSIRQRMFEFFIQSLHMVAWRNKGMGGVHQWEHSPAAIHAVFRRQEASSVAIPDSSQAATMLCKLQATHIQHPVFTISTNSLFTSHFKRGSILELGED